MQQVNVGQRILEEDLKWARENARLFRQHRIACFNIISSPGAGKTSILVETIRQLAGKVRIGVIEGDIETNIDAERIGRTGAPTIQINTKGACHLSAVQVCKALGGLPLSDLDLVMIENIGNLVCPGIFDLGEHGKVAVLSTPEGDDKPAKYPGVFCRATAVLINKMDLKGSGAVPFDVDKVIADIHRLNRNVQVFPMSALSGQGVDRWCQWLQQQVGFYRGISSGS